MKTLREAQQAYDLRGEPEDGFDGPGEAEADCENGIHLDELLHPSRSPEVGDIVKCVLCGREVEL